MCNSVQTAQKINHGMTRSSLIHTLVELPGLLKKHGFSSNSTRKPIVVTDTYIPFSKKYVQDNILLRN